MARAGGQGRRGRHERHLRAGVHPVPEHADLQRDRTTLLGQQDNDHAMPLDDFLTEALGVLREKPDANEIVVERARFIRDAVANGTHQNVLAMISGS